MMVWFGDIILSDMNNTLTSLILARFIRQQTVKTNRTSTPNWTDH
jgi:hypothetical protein